MATRVLVLCLLACFPAAFASDSVSTNFRLGLKSTRLSADASQDLSTHTISAWSFIAREVTVRRISTMTLVLLSCFFCCCFLPGILWCIMVCTLTTMVKKDIAEMQNSLAKEYRTKFDEECPEGEKKKYESKEFKERCDKLFEEADADKNGTLDTQEIREPVMKYIGEKTTEETIVDSYVERVNAPGVHLEYRSSLEDAFMKAFDANNSGTIDTQEFFEMMKYLAWRKDEAEGPKEPQKDEEKAKTWWW